MKKGLITSNSKTTHMHTEYQSYRMDEKESHSIKLNFVNKILPNVFLSHPKGS
jgi:hypothetical protein